MVEAHGQVSGGEVAAAESQDILKVFGRSSIMGDINVTPMVDVMLVLLIIFMVVTPALVAGFQAQLPQGINLKDRPEEEGRTSLGVDAFGAYYLNKAPLRACTAEQRTALLDDIAWPQKASKELSHGVAFFNSFRDLTASGFWTTKMGIEDLQYMGNRYVAEWNGCPDEACKKLGVSYPPE